MYLRMNECCATLVIYTCCYAKSSQYCSCTCIHIHCNDDVTTQSAKRPRMRGACTDNNTWYIRSWSVWQYFTKLRLMYNILAGSSVLQYCCSSHLFNSTSTRLMLASLRVAPNSQCSTANSHSPWWAILEVGACH